MFTFAQTNIGTAPRVPDQPLPGRGERFGPRRPGTRRGLIFPTSLGPGAGRRLSSRGGGFAIERRMLPTRQIEVDRRAFADLALDPHMPAGLAHKAMHLA